MADQVGSWLAVGRDRIAQPSTVGRTGRRSGAPAADAHAVAALFLDGMVAAQTGVKIAPPRVAGATLKRLFAGLLRVLAGKMLWNLFA